MARAALRWQVRELANAARISANTVIRVESDMPANHTTLDAIRRVFEAEGIEFWGDGDAPGVRLHRKAD